MKKYEKVEVILSETDKRNINGHDPAGAAKFIVKPFNRSEIIDSLKAVI
jgi:FixJ family two-component response regulator